MSKNIDLLAVALLLAGIALSSNARVVLSGFKGPEAVGFTRKAGRPLVFCPKIPKLPHLSIVRY